MLSDQQIIERLAKLKNGLDMLHWTFESGMIKRQIEVLELRRPSEMRDADKIEIMQSANETWRQVIEGIDEANNENPNIRLHYP